MSTKKKNGGILAASLVAAGIGTAFAAYTAAIKYFMDIAFDRKAPRSFDKAVHLIAGTSGSKEAAAAAEAAREAGQRLLERNPEPVSIDASLDGAMLAGHYLEAEHPRRVIIAMHGWRSSWYNDFGTVVDEWLEDGSSILFAEQRGQQNSAGDYISFGILEQYDCRDWAEWVDRRIGGTLPVYLAGISMGATTVLLASGLELPASVHGILADCGFTSPDAIWKHVLRNNLHLPYDSALNAKLAQKKIGVSPEGCSTEEALKKNTRPVLFVHGTEDTFVPIEMTYRNFMACTAPKRLYVVPGAGHGTSHTVDPVGYRKALNAFFAEFDAG